MSNVPVKWKCCYCSNVNVNYREVDEQCRCQRCEFNATWDAIDSNFALQRWLQDVDPCTEPLNRIGTPYGGN